MSVEVGDEAPDFLLPDSEGGKTKLSDFRGRKNVLLLFFPAAFSPVCPTEFCTFRDVNADINSDETAVLGISIDNAWTLRAWKQAEGFPNAFLSDFWPHGDVTSRYGVLNDERGTAMRATVLIDKDGVVRWKEINPRREPREQEAWRIAIAAIGARSRRQGPPSARLHWTPCRVTAVAASSRILRKPSHLRGRGRLFAMSRSWYARCASGSFRSGPTKPSDALAAAR